LTRLPRLSKRYRICGDPGAFGHWCPKSEHAGGRNVRL
jgi:hypothetical protein